MGEEHLKEKGIENLNLVSFSLRYLVLYIWSSRRKYLTEQFYFDFSVFLWPKIEQKIQLKFCFYLFLFKIAFYLSPGLHKGSPRYRRILQHFKKGKLFSMLVDHFCTPGSGSWLRIRIRIQGPHWIRILIRIHNTVEKNKENVSLKSSMIMSSSNPSMGQDSNSSMTWLAGSPVVSTTLLNVPPAGGWTGTVFLSPVPRCRKGLRSSCALGRAGPDGVEVFASVAFFRVEEVVGSFGFICPRMSPRRVSSDRLMSSSFFFLLGMLSSMFLMLLPGTQGRESLIKVKVSMRWLKSR